MNIHLLFDIDGTLLLSGGAGWKAMKVAFSKHFEIEEFETVPVHGRTDRGIVAELFANTEIEDTELNREKFFECYLEQLPHSLQSSDGSLLPKVSQLLDSLASRNDVTMGLLTGNIEPAAWAKVRHFGIDHHFQFGGFGGQDQHRNQVAERAWNAAKKLSPDLEPSKTIVLGDTTRDVECARWIDCHCIGVLTGGSSADEMAKANPDLLFEDFSDTDAVLSGIEQLVGV